MKTYKIIIGTRGSQLSLAQTNIIKEQLLSLYPHLKIEITVIKTKGDKNMSPVPLDSIGKGWFTKELDKALLTGQIDMAVHSLKDIPEILEEGLIIAAIPKREDAGEALISKNGETFEALKKASIIGTDSTRRKAQILQKRNDLVIKSVRGNINRRLEKLDNGEYDALCLAVAGLKRLGLEKRISEYFNVTDFIPSPGQGALAIVIKKNNKKLYRILQKISHAPTVCEVKAERAFSEAVGGGCKMPVGAYAKIRKGKLTLHAFVGSVNGTHNAKDFITGDITKPVHVGKKLGQKFVRYVVITRPESDNTVLQTKLEKIGVSSFLYPSIKVEKNVLTALQKKKMEDIESFDWILFTSRYGVQIFIKKLQELHIDPKMLQTKQIGAVGPKTAEEIKKCGLQVHFTPTRFTTDDLGKEIKNVKGKKILLPRSHIATPKLTAQLQAKGALVTNIPIYKTTYIVKQNKKFIDLLNENKIHCVIFTSPSTVEGFIKSFKKDTDKEKIYSIPVLSIGPVTTEAAKKHGFLTIFTAETHTTEGMLSKLQESIL